jgi:hypothetical protein
MRSAAKSTPGNRLTTDATAINATESKYELGSI